MTKVSTLEESTLLTENAIANYLKEQPDFFLRHQDLLTCLNIPHEERGAISLVEMQLVRLRERVGELEEEITQLMSIAVNNEKLYQALAEAHIELFKASNDVAIHHMLKKLGEKLNLFVNLRLYDSEQYPITKLETQRIKASHFAGQRIYLGRLRKADGDVFIEHAPELGSYLLIPLVMDDKECGFLSFASTDGGHFQPSMDTLFVEQLAQHIVASNALMSAK